VARAPATPKLPPFKNLPTETPTQSSASQQAIVETSASCLIAAGIHIAFNPALIGRPSSAPRFDDIFPVPPFGALLTVIHYPC